ncbi:MAG TPA: HAD-IC family P-type ATPase, partial [Kofleriaceae bacterium]
KLDAIETLGCATVICSDKTGTLTTGVMTVRDTWTTDLHRLLDAAAACCDANLESGLGDSTELAILAEAARIGISTDEIERTRPRVEVEPFDPATKRMRIRRGDGLVYAKGAVEVMVAADRADVHAAATRMAAAGLRVLAIACGPEIGALDVVGLIGIADAPRSDVVEAIRTAHRAGIRTVMITGDHALTARAIAGELGLARDGESLEDVVFARTSPQQKLEIVRDLIARGEIVAMTGDGVNDAPALREAHVGIAMGKTGTEVAREVSQIVLADDNFATIVAAVREGRAIFDNIRKALVYLLAGNAAELAVMLIASLAGLPLPLLPLQLLWINLITDGLPALALVIDPPASDVMARPPRPAREPILRASEWRLIAASATLEAGVTLGSYVWALDHGGVESARALAFAVLVASELLRAFAFRSRSRVLWSVGAFGNLTLVAVVVGSLLAQVVVLYVPSIRAVIAGGVLTPAEGALALGLGLIPVTVLELVKLVGLGTWLAEREV